MNDSDKTREQLIEEINLLRTLLDTLPDRIFVKDTQGRFVICNKAVEQVAEIHPPDGVIGKSDFDLYPPERAKEYYAREQEIMKTGIPMLNEEVCGVHPVTKGPSWSLSTKMPWRDKDGKIIGIIGSNRDSTERKLTEQALIESETRYKAILESAKEGILIVDVETKRPEYANPALCRMFGYTEEEFCRKAIYDIHPGSYAQEIKDSLAMHRQNKGVKLLANVACVRKDDTTFYADLKILAVMARQKMCHLVFFTDITERKHTEDALRESEARYKAIFNSATEGIVVTDVETKRHRYVNPAACRMFGYTCEEFQQMSVYDIHPKEYMPSVIAGFDAQARGEKTLVPNVPCLHKNGTVFYANIDTTCVVIDHRPCNVGLFTNITERKHAEEALRQSEEKFRGLTERSFDLIFATDAKGFINYVSPASERIFDYKPGEMTGRHFTAFLKESEIPRAAERFADKLQGKQLGSLNLEAKKKDGSGVFIELISSLVIQNGITVGTQGIIRDVTERIKSQQQLQQAHIELESRVQQRTSDLAGAVEKLQKEIAERKRAEESLRQAEERFRTIFENAVVGIYRTTPDGTILIANPSLIKLLGYNSFEELSRVNLEKEGFDPATPRSIFKQRIERDSFVSGLESIWLRRDGSRLYVLENAFAVRDDNGNVIYYEGTAQDITKRKEAEEKLMLYQEQLQSLASQLSLAEERLRRKIATDLHDNVSQNLAISKMKLDSLAQSVNPEQAKTLKEVADLIGQTIEVSRSLTFEMSPPVLYELGFIAAMEWLAKQTRQRFDIETEFIDDGRPKPLVVDVSVLLFQAVRELLANVVKHAKARNVRITTTRIRGNISITVEDDGLGFDMKQATSARKGSSKKNASDYLPRGFGLFNIRERLNHIGGTIEIHSKSGRGTLVILIAPLLKTRKNLAKTKKKMK